MLFHAFDNLIILLKVTVQLGYFVKAFLNGFYCQMSAHSAPNYFRQLRDHCFYCDVTD